MAEERTQVVIVGAGPAGMLLSHLLAADGVDSIVVETRSEEYVAARIRAGAASHGMARSRGGPRMLTRLFTGRATSRWKTAG